MVQLIPFVFNHETHPTQCNIRIYLTDTIRLKQFSRLCEVSLTIYFYSLKPTSSISFDCFLGAFKGFFLPPRKKQSMLASCDVTWI